MPPLGKFESLEKETMSKFIEMFEMFPCLWDTNSEAFKNPKKKEYKDQREKAYSNLLIALKKNVHYRDATEETIKYLVKSLFSSFKTQHRNVTLNRNYQPKPWYHELAKFLLPQSNTGAETHIAEVEYFSDDDDASTIRRSPSPDEFPAFMSEVDSGDYSRSSVQQDRSDDKIIPKSSRRSSFSAGDPDMSPPQEKRRKCDSSLATPSSSSSSSVDEAFGSYIMMALKNMKPEQCSKAKVEIFRILENGNNDLL